MHRLTNTIIDTGGAEPRVNCKAAIVGNGYQPDRAPQVGTIGDRTDKSRTRSVTSNKVGGVSFWEGERDQMTKPIKTGDR